MDRFAQFLAAFRRIEHALRKTAGKPGTVESFTSVLHVASSRSLTVRRHQDFLRTINTLRNALVHEGFEGATLAEPTEGLVAQVEKVAGVLVQSPLLPKYVFCPVNVFDVSATLGATLQFMQRQDFSQVPVAAAGKFVGLLTTNAIALWLAQHVDEEVVDIKNTRVADVLGAPPSRNGFRFCTSKTNCESIIAIFAGVHEKGGLLQAVLLTDNGKPDTNIRGIVTVHDLGRLYDRLA